MKSLIAFYSRRGENYIDGAVKTLTVGNTELVVAVLQKLTGADCFQIEPCQDYPADYYQCIDLACQDLRKGIRPKLKRLPDSIAPYDVIYLGYPNYWGTMPMPVFSFLEQFDFSEKIIKPFCTHEGSGMGRSEQDLRRLCPTAHIMQGLSMRGAQISQEISTLETWVKER